MANQTLVTMAASSIPPPHVTPLQSSAIVCAHSRGNPCDFSAAGIAHASLSGASKGLKHLRFTLSRKLVLGKPACEKWRGPVCESKKDTRIHWTSDTEGWLGVSSTPQPTVSADTSVLQRVPVDLLPLLLAAPSTHYKVLGVSPEANAEDIKAAYRRLSKQYHPDSTSLPLEVAADKFMRLKEAHSILSSPEQRRLYDWKLAQEMSRDLGGRFVWPYEVDRSQRGAGGRPAPPMAAQKEKAGANLELSSQAVSALAFDAFALFVSILVIIYVIYFKN